MEKKTNETKMKNKKDSMQCENHCNVHGTLSIRGRNFEGTIKKIVGQRIVLEMERIIYYPKYELYSRVKSKMHAHVPKCMMSTIKVGDYVEVGECRPISKLVHFALVKRIR